MLTVLYPSIIQELASLEAGLWPIILPDGAPILLVKSNKEALLAAKIAKSLRLYFVPSTRSDSSVLGVITAFSDDADEPLTLTSPLFDADVFGADLITVLSAPYFALHFFDEHNRELLGYQVSNREGDRVCDLAQRLRFAPFSFELAKAFHDLMKQWFGERTAEDDEQAFQFEFGEALVPEDLFVIDATVKDHRGVRTITHTTLDRAEPGKYQEEDIALLLRRVFPPQSVFLNPARTDDGREFVDVLVATPHRIYLLQAKDSPNTAEVLARPLQRKRSTVIHQTERACRQMRGSINYASLRNHIAITINGIEHGILTDGRSLQGIIVVKEMFPDEHPLYTAPALRIAEETGVPTIVIDYAQLHSLTLHVYDEAAFDRGVLQIYETGLITGGFPRLRFGLTDKSFL
jgi:hypothetical protein